MRRQAVATDSARRTSGEGFIRSAALARSEACPLRFLATSQEANVLASRPARGASGTAIDAGRHHAEDEVPLRLTVSVHDRRPALVVAFVVHHGAAFGALPFDPDSAHRHAPHRLRCRRPAPTARPWPMMALGGAPVLPDSCSRISDCGSLHRRGGGVARRSWDGHCRGPHRGGRGIGSASFRRAFSAPVRPRSLVKHAGIALVSIERGGGPGNSSLVQVMTLCVSVRTFQPSRSRVMR